MKRGMMRWDDEDSSPSSSDESSSSGSDSEANKKTGKKRKTIARFAKKDRTFDYESLQQHGYKTVSLPDIPSPEEKPDWSWSTGKEKPEAKEVEETYQERQQTRAAVVEGEKLVNVQTRSERKNLSFAQKEKRKRELGQASRGKNYVEEEKRLLRDSGVYSGFDS